MFSLNFVLGKLSSPQRKIYYAHKFHFFYQTAFSPVKISCSKTFFPNIFLTLVGQYLTVAKTLFWIYLIK